MAEVMKQFVNLKDGIVFATHESSTEIDVEGDDIYQVEGKASDYLGMKYDNGVFSEPSVIRYAILDKDNTVVTINKTIFSSEVGSNIVITDPNVEVLWKWNGTSFEPPFEVGQHNVIFVDSVPVSTSTDMPALPADTVLAINSRHEAEIAAVEASNARMQAAFEEKLASGWVDPNAPVPEISDIEQ